MAIYNNIGSFTKSVFILLARPAQDPVRVCGCVKDFFFRRRKYLGNHRKPSIVFKTTHVEHVFSEIDVMR